MILTAEIDIDSTDGTAVSEWEVMRAVEEEMDKVLDNVKIYDTELGRDIPMCGSITIKEN